tara:strand:- start:938 stop:1129 length:192 start_codon:yes stop_codon:yes gene_type:complete
MVDLIVLKEQWEEFKQLYAQDMYKDKVLHMTEEADKDNVRVTFTDYIGYEMLFNFIQSKKRGQ